MAGPSTYAYKNVVGSMTDPDVGIYLFQGQVGIKHLMISNTVDRGVIDIAADGAVMVSYIAGANGGIQLEMQQTSSLHQFLTNWANVKFTDADNGNAENFAAAAIKVQDLLSGQSKTLTGVFPVKIPDVPYGDRGATVTWQLLAANVVSQ
jgi:hypothetical protein